jgi:hypothetical protein
MPWWSLWSLENQLAQNLGCSKFTLGQASILAHLICNFNAWELAITIYATVYYPYLGYIGWSSNTEGLRMVWWAGHGLFGHGAWREVVAHLWLHLQSFRSLYLDERPGKYGPTHCAYNCFKTSTGPLARTYKKNSLLLMSKHLTTLWMFCKHLTNVADLTLV